MLKMYIVDISAESRTRISRCLENLLSVQLPDMELVPRITMRSVSISEFRFQAPPNVCVIGPELCNHEISLLSSIRKQIPDVPILACVSPDDLRLSSVDQVLRMGADDLLPIDISARDFFRKLLVHCRQRPAEQHGGKLILVDSAKGGVGATTMVAALGDALYQKGKRTCLIDLDTESQDLCRFIQARPFVNDNLGLMLQENRPIAEEDVEQCLVPLDPQSNRLSCLAPAPELQNASTLTNYTRTFLSLIEMLDEKFDIVLVDIASAPTLLVNALYHVADSVIYLLNNDPASFFSASARASRLKSLLSPDARFVAVEIATGREGLSAKTVRDEFARQASVEAFDGFIPFFKHGQHWPGSGSTLYSLGNSAYVDAVDGLCSALGFAPSNIKSALKGPLQVFLDLNAKAMQLTRRALLSPLTHFGKPNLNRGGNFISNEQQLLSAPIFQISNGVEDPKELLKTITFN